MDIKYRDKVWIRFGDGGGSYSSEVEARKWHEIKSVTIERELDISATFGTATLAITTGHISVEAFVMGVAGMMSAGLTLQATKFAVACLGCDIRHGKEVAMAIADSVNLSPPATA